MITISSLRKNEEERLLWIFTISIKKTPTEIIESKSDGIWCCGHGYLVHHKEQKSSRQNFVLVLFKVSSYT